MTKVNREDVSFCQSCYCSTHTIDGKCGKCGATKVNREWGEVFFEQMKTVRGLSASQYMKVRDIFEEIIPKVKSQTRNDLLREIMEEMPKPMKMKPAEETGSHAGWGMVTGFNDCHDQVNTILERKMK